MRKTITVKGVNIGEGMPKICVPMVGKNLTQLKEEAEQLKTMNIDLVEWRVDFFEQVEELLKVKEVLKVIRTILKDIPLIFTFRSAKEGGEKEIDCEYYFTLNKDIMETGLVDFIDVELFSDENEAHNLIELAHSKGIFVIVSNHDFQQTPAKEEIIARLRRAQEIGGDISKIAVMPKKTSDIITLLDATVTMYEHYANRPLITMSMAGQGVVSRLAGEIFGSAVTFGSAMKASAPGQVSVAELKPILNLLHQNMNKY